MTILMIACSRRGWELMCRLEEKWKREKPADRLVCLVKCSAMPERSERRSLSECVGEWFDKADAIIFLCAAGIAVRAVAPFLKHKSKDPAVVAVDESARFAVSLLSGHAGGANALAERIGELLGALPVITTATDRAGLFAVDEFARKNELAVTDWKRAKEISARILEGKRMGIGSEVPVCGELPEELYLCSNENEADIWISWKRRIPGGLRTPAAANAPGKSETGQECHIKAGPEKPGGPAEPLYLVPRRIVAGIGCRKGIDQEQVEEALEACLLENGIRPEALCAAASIDRKAEEKGLLACCRKRELPFYTYSADQLLEVEGEFTGSEFVERVTGVDNVCERSAMAAAGEGGRLICPKKSGGGVTVALAEKKGWVRF